MIVEFCKYGNLSNYLRSKREDFMVYKVSRVCMTHAMESAMVAAVFDFISFNLIYVLYSEPGW